MRKLIGKNAMSMVYIVGLVAAGVIDVPTAVPMIMGANIGTTITAQLIAARTGYHRWSEEYDRDLADIFAVQDEIAGSIANALVLRLSGAEVERLYRGGTEDVEAYELYLVGRQKWAPRNIPELREAVEHFEGAIARDSGFALAWSGLADALDALMYRVPEERTRLPEAQYAAQRALVLEPELAEGWASLGVLALDFNRDWRFAELALQRAIEIKPSYSTPYHWLADVYRYSGRAKRAESLGNRAVELDPISGLGRDGKAFTSVLLRKFDEAAREAKKASVPSPIHPTIAAAHQAAPNRRGRPGCWARSRTRWSSRRKSWFGS